MTELSFQDTCIQFHFTALPSCFKTCHLWTPLTHLDFCSLNSSSTWALWWNWDSNSHCLHVHHGSVCMWLLTPRPRLQHKLSFWQSFLSVPLGTAASMWTQTHERDPHTGQGWWLHLSISVGNSLAISKYGKNGRKKEAMRNILSSAMDRYPFHSNV